jgi:hypothetical protein
LEEISTIDGCSFLAFSLLLGFGACHNVAASEQEVPSIHNGNSFPWKCCFILSFDHNFANHCLD